MKSIDDDDSPEKRLNIILGTRRDQLYIQILPQQKCFWKLILAFSCFWSSQIWSLFSIPRDQGGFGAGAAQNALTLAFFRFGDRAVPSLLEDRKRAGIYYVPPYPRSLLLSYGRSHAGICNNDRGGMLFREAYFRWDNDSGASYFFLVGLLTVQLVLIDLHLDYAGSGVRERGTDMRITAP